MATDEQIDQHLEARRREREMRRGAAEHRAMATASLASVVAEMAAGERLAAQHKPMVAAQQLAPQRGALAARMAAMVRSEASLPPAPVSASTAAAQPIQRLPRGALAARMRQMVNNDEI